MTDDQRPDPLPDASPQDDAGAEFLAAQDGEYQAAIERAYVEYVPDDEKLQKAKRRRITSRTIMAVLAVIAVLLTAGGIAGPQVVYAYEASRFTDIVRDVDASATQAEDLAALAEAEALLWELRSEESRDLPARLIALSQRPGEALSDPFAAELAASADAITSALAPPTKAAKQVRLAEKAAEARASELPDPMSWFDVDGDVLAEFAAIEPTPLARVDSKGTVTLERVQEARKLLETTQATIASETERIESRSKKNVALSDALDAAATQVSAESTRVSAAALTATATQVAEVVEGTEIAPEVEQLRLAATDLELAAQVSRFAVTETGEVVGIAPDAELPDGAMVIPGGSSVRLNYLLPRLEAFLGAFDAEAAVRVAAEEAALAAAELAAQQELLRQQQLEQIPPAETPPEVVPDSVPDPVTPPEPTTDPEPPTEPPADLASVG